MSSALIPLEVPRGAYPERPDATRGVLDEWGARGARRLRHALRGLRRPWHGLPEQVRAVGAELAGLTDRELRWEADALRVSLRERGLEAGVVARSFALVREAASRSLGLLYYDVQLVGGWVLLHGMVAEMETGEGKTLTAALPACTAALAGVPVHVITVNDYLARRDAEWMGPIYRSLGLTVSVVVSGMSPAERREAYGADVVYASNKEIVFDYLKDRIALGTHPSRVRLRIERLMEGPGVCDRLLHRGLHFAIVDEADSVLVDEARTPLIISGPSKDPAQEEIFATGIALARELRGDLDFEVDEGGREVRLLPPGRQALAERGEEVGGIFRGERRREELVCMALKALHCFHRDHHYLVQDERIQIVDEYTGRVMRDRSWESGLHQMIEVKEGVAVTVRPETLARISYQRFFRRYLRLAGMTGTAREVTRELLSVYGLCAVRIPPRRPPRRRLLRDRVVATREEKWRLVTERIAELHAAGQPVLVGTRTVAASEALARRLEARGIPHRVLNARQDDEEAAIVAGAGEVGRVTVATNMAGRGTDIRLDPRVAALGGLCVLMTERHEAARIDRQLFGRCGRQGDPGAVEVCVALEDELFETHAGSAARALARAAAGRADSPPGQRALRLAVRWAQRSAERRHARARRELLRRDAQLERMLAFSGRFE